MTKKLIDTLPNVPVYLGLGSNLNDRFSYLVQAYTLIRQYYPIYALSSIYETDSFYEDGQPSYFNAVLLVDGIEHNQALNMLYRLQTIEKSMGRLTHTQNQPRFIDIDILFYGEENIQTSQLHIPHPCFKERIFCLRPLAEINPHFRHPLDQTPIEKMIEEVKKTLSIKKVIPQEKFYEEILTQKILLDS